MDGAVGWAPLARVVEQVADRAVEAGAVTADRRRAQVRLEVAVATLDAARHQLGEVELLEVALRRALARELDEVADQAGQLAQLRQQVLAQLHPLLGRELARAREQLDVGLHGGERRAQLRRGVPDGPALGAAAPRPRP